MSTDYDFESITEAGLTQGEFAELTKASRSTVGNWMRGKAKPTAAYKDRVRKLLVVLRYAAAHEHLPGDIPTVYKSNMTSRMKYIRDTLKSTVSEMKDKQKG